MKKEFLTIDELKPIMNYFAIRLRNIRSLQNLINEYNDCDKNVRLLQSYRKYFETLYSSAGSMILIDLYNIFDNQPDTFAIDLVANRVLKSFDNLAKQDIPTPYTFAAKNYNKEEFQNQIGKINQSISGLTEKIRIIRNKEGLGHGMKYSFETRLSFDEVNILCQSAYDYYNLISERFLGESYAFTKSIIKTPSLCELIEEYEHIPDCIS